MPKEKTLTIIFLIIFFVITSCSSSDNITGEAIVIKGDIYEPSTQIEQEVEQHVEVKINESQEEINKTPLINNQPKEKTEDFKFSPESIVSTQHNISLSLDGIKHEIKSEYWGKITEITVTVLNKGNKAFKPKVLVLLYDDKDFKEEWFKPKAEIGFDIEQLNIREHITKQAIVNIAFDDISLTKNFKLILVEASDPANKAIIVVETEFKAGQNQT